jgi:hypothetical protein
MHWSRRGLSITVAGPDGTTTVQLSKPFARVGSRPGSEIRLTHPGISGQAAYFHATEHDIWCCSLARSGGKPAKLQRIRPGTGIHLGPYRLSADFAQSTSGSHDRESSSELAARSAQHLALKLTSPQHNAIEHLLSSSFEIIGRGLPSTILLDDDSASRVHCLLYRQGDELWIVDLLSQNGTRRSGKRCEAMHIAPGERVAIGSYTLSYSSGDSQSRQQDVLPPPTPMIVEQTIVREQREQIVTRVVTHGGNPLDRPGEYDAPVEMPPFDSSLSTSIPYQRIEPAKRAHLQGPDHAERELLAPPTHAVRQPRITGQAPALLLDKTHDAEQDAGERIPSPAVSPVDRGKQQQALPRVEPTHTKKTRETTGVDNSGSEPGNQVLDRLIDINTRHAVQSRRRTLVIAAICAGVAALAAVACLLWMGGV